MDPYPMYKILGSDQKEYGPVNEETVRQWIAQGRANAHTRVQPEGRADWIALSEVSEFAEALAAGSQPAAAPPPQAVPSFPTATPSKTSGLREEEVSPQTVLLFEAEAGWNASGGPEQMITHHRGTYTVAFADGSVMQVSQSQLGTLRWDP